MPSFQVRRLSTDHDGKRFLVNVRVYADGVESFIQTGVGRTESAAMAHATRLAKKHVEKARKDG